MYFKSGDDDGSETHSLISRWQDVIPVTIALLYTNGEMNDFVKARRQECGRWSGGRCSERGEDNLHRVESGEHILIGLGDQRERCLDGLVNAFELTFETTDV